MSPPGFDRDRLSMVGIFALALAARVGFWLFNGIIYGADDYTSVCSLWVSDPIAAVFAHKGIFYAGFTVPHCLVLALPGATELTWVFVQMVLSALGCVLLYRTGKSLIDYEAGLVAGLALAVLWDTFLWSVADLSDSLFILAVTFVAWALVRHVQSPSTRTRLVVFLGLGYLTVVRPYGIAFVVGWLAFDLFADGSGKRLQILPGRVLPGSVFALAPLGVPYFVERYHVLRSWHRGWIIWKDPSFFIYEFSFDPNQGVLAFVLDNLHHVLAMGILRVLVFFAPFVPRHSPFHILVNLVTMLPIYLIGLYGLLRARKENYRLVQLCVGPTVAILLVTAITFVSYDFRYRAPLGPLFALAFGYAVSSVLEERGVW